jgi:hypothetical protein
MNKPKQERRNEARHRGLKGARIVFKGHETLIDCTKRLCNYLEQFKRDLSINSGFQKHQPRYWGDVAWPSY